MSSVRTPAKIHNNPPPVVMTFGGHDPTGGAGIQADIETLISLGCHCTPIITALTIQDTQNVQQFSPCSQTDFIAQARAVLEDMPVAAFKIGMVGSVATAEAIHSILVDYPQIPVVFDPVLAAGGGGDLATGNLIKALLNLIIPLTTLITPNGPEARKLCRDADSLPACAQMLLDSGCNYVLLTGGHEPDAKIINRLWHGHDQYCEYETPRIPGNFHGTGCTLAAACAGYIAHGANIEAAARDAQDFTTQSVAQARRLGMGQAIPHRLFWSKELNE